MAPCHLAEQKTIRIPYNLCLQEVNYAPITARIGPLGRSRRQKSNLTHHSESSCCDSVRFGRKIRPRRSKGCHELFVRNKAVHNIHNQALKLGMAHKTRGTRTNYPSDLSDEEWAFCARYLTLMREDAPQRDYPLRATFNALRYMVRAGCPWRMMPNDLPPWYSVQQQAQRWIRAGCFEAMATICARCCGCLPAGTQTFGRDP